MSADRILVRCDGAPAPRRVGSSWDNEIAINSSGPGADLTLRAQNLAGTVLTEVSDRAADLVRIGTYIYAADQAVSRGGNVDVYRRDWQRNLIVCMPVCDTRFWQDDEVRVPLSQLLHFLTNDTWQLEFVRGEPDHRQLPLIADDARFLGSPDTIVLLSGGLDSLCAAVDAVATGRRPLLVSHSPAPNVGSRQRQLTQELRRQFQSWGFPHLHFAIHRRGASASDSSQRSRAFLFASLAAAVASELVVSEVLLADNGVVSLNLPFNDQLVGALASRSTHPKFIYDFNRLIESTCERPVNLVNPLSFRTRAEAVELLKQHNCQETIELTVSCSRERGRPSAQRHCGRCSQCVDRRFGTVAADLEEYDLAEQYETDVFTHALPEGEARTVAVSWVRFAQRFAHLSDDEIFEEYPQLYECILETDRDPDDTARSLCELLRRHAETTLRVVAMMLARESHALSAGVLPETALLRLVVGVEPRVERDASSASTIRKEGRYWTLTFKGRQVQLGGRIGPQYLAILLRNPGQPIHVNKLVSGGITDKPGTSALAEGLDKERPLADPLANKHAVKEYENRLRQLERYPAQGPAVQREIAQLRRAISQARGPHGRPQAFPDEGEKNRQSVSKALRRTLKDIATYHPKLWQHLNRALDIGFTCRYDPELPTQWET